MKIIRSDILSRFPEITCGMSTTEGGLSGGTLKLNLSFNVNDDPALVSGNRKLFFDALEVKENAIAFTRQQHTAIITSVSQPGQQEVCDALITAKKGIFLAISIADCTPVLMYDPYTPAVAAIHAGWRGTAEGIVEKTIGRMKEEFGTKPAHLFAFIGPAAGKCCYEVDKDVADRFPSDCAMPKDNGKYLLDVKYANVMQLLENGVRNANIEINPECTIQNKLFHSHRRDGANSGRMFAVIGMNI